MKYFTKEWYQQNQKTGFHLLLQEDSQAATFSEEHFQQVYNSELERWLQLEEEIASFMKNNEILHREHTREYTTFNREKAIEEFHESFVFNQAYLEKNLPESILNRIADIRVFTLNKATQDIIDAVTAFCEENEAAVNATIEQYENHMDSHVNELDKDIIEHFGFRDCTITNAERTDNSLTLSFDHTDGFTNVEQIIFENINILKQDAALERTSWLYEEVYKVDDKYEIHILLQDKNMELIDLILSVDRVDFRIAVGV